MSLLLCLSLAIAQDAPETPTDTEVDEEVDAEEPSVQTLQQLLLELQAEAEVNATSLAKAQKSAADADALVRSLLVLQQRDATTEERFEALKNTAILGDDRALPFLYAELPRSDERGKVAIGIAIHAWPDNDLAKTIARELVEQRGQPAARRAGFTAMQKMSEDPLAIEMLEQMVFDREEPDEIRQLARKTLESRYPQFEIGANIEIEAAKGAVGMYSVGSTIVGASTLAFVGALGQSDAGITVGVLGGALAGGAAGGLYARSKAMEREDAVQSTTAILWGSYAGTSSAVLLGQQGFSTGPITSSGLLALGSGAGMLAAELQPGAPDLGDQGEVHIAGLIGFTGGTGIGSLLAESNLASSTATNVSGMLGTAAGLGIGKLLQPTWQLDGSEAPLTGLTSVQGLWAGSLIPVVADGNGLQGASFLGLATGTTGGLILSELSPASKAAVGGNAFGWLSGNALGAGLAMASQQRDASSAQLNASAILLGGALGAGIGHNVGPKLTMEPGDAAFIGVTGVWMTGNALSIGAFLESRTNFTNPGALTMTTLGATLPATAFLSQQIDPAPGEVLLATAGGGWGLWYGLMVPLAIGGNGEAVDLGLSMTITSDVFILGTTALMVTTDLDPSRTAVPQLLALTGATVGALGTALATPDGQTISAGTVLGSTAGFALGAIIESKRDASDIALARPNMRTGRLPGQWMPMLAPMVTEDGSTGVHVGISATGW